MFPAVFALKFWIAALTVTLLLEKLGYNTQTLNTALFLEIT